jgi:glutathione S-transferase
VHVPTLITEKGDAVTDSSEIAHHLLSVQPMWAEFFLGKTEEEQR